MEEEILEIQELGIGTRVKHKDYGNGVVIQIKSISYIITFIDYGNREIAKTNEDLEVIDLLESPEDMISFDTVEMILTKILRKHLDIQEVVQMSERWSGGTLILKPANPDLKPYEIPISNFFNKIILIRDRLRVMEQKINSSNLSDEEKITLQQYITRSYGSLTSFNVLFKNKIDNFVGEAGGK
ncbi:MAG: hypothetical protein LBV69_08160 [Bacteroidales bacterium]|jgi:hypothetical protein|nr:hypothetical protein [Bacteroidales bacterium]